MIRRKPLPPPVVGRAFSTREALSLGASSKQLRASDLQAPFHGARLPAGTTALRDRCMALQAVATPTLFISHSTAARLYGVPLPWRLQRDSAIHATVAKPARAPQRPGVIGHSWTPGAHYAPWLDSRGLRISRAARIWLDLASQLDLVELVIAGDYLLRGFRQPNGRRTPFVTMNQLRDEAASNPARRHGRLISAALDLIRERVDSPYETRLRLIVQSAGFPDPIVNEPILDARGDTIAQPDLRIPGFNVGLEYQGDGHRTNRSQWQRDVVRRRELDAIKWKTIEAVALDIRNPGHLLHTLEQELRERGWTGTPTWPTLGIET
ncbi:hypothetical protein ASF06_07750 [Agreia sp. Leaf244]|uniref:hypothetical protein n=1 Tax=Agreia sp. Leaf244 TaxID=1736305 RepID=UPI0006F9691A|nr:hypothetical protein [Agreia sp. Leaf244]KQO10098.1 hypothetical protein ASF06_07750 [Agreia sp. Leaf244]